MNDIDQIIDCLEKSPTILKNLLDPIPSELFRQKRTKDKWCIHEHACHIATGDQIGMIDRLNKFLSEAKPKLIPFSGDDFPSDYLFNLDLNRSLENFFEKRREVICFVRSVNKVFWMKEAEHPEYKIYTPYIMLRHRLMHDHYHMYRIEELWLTNEDYL